MNRKPKAFYPVTGKGLCGPTALAALTGVCRDRVRTSIATRRGHKHPGAVRGIYRRELLSAAAELAGVQFQDVPVAPVNGKQLTVLAWRQLDCVEEMFDRGWKAITVTRSHFIAMSKSLALDTSHKNEPHHYLSNPFTRQRILRVLWLRPREETA